MIYQLNKSKYLFKYLFKYLLTFIFSSDILFLNQLTKGETKWKTEKKQ